MNEAGTYDGYGYRLWMDNGWLWVGLAPGTAAPIPIEDAPALAELLLRAFNDQEIEKEKNK